MIKDKFIVILFSLLPCIGISQVFNGKVSYANFYLDKKTMEPLFPQKDEDVWFGNAAMRVQMLNLTPGEGGLD